MYDELEQEVEEITSADVGTIEVPLPPPTLTKAQITSREQAHAIKVAKFLAGGKF